MVYNTEYYDILGVSTDATFDDIRKAYHKKALQEHPDKGGSPEKFQMLVASYEVLSDEIKRSNYDIMGKNTHENIQFNFNPINAQKKFWEIFGNFGGFTQELKTPSTTYDYLISLEKLCTKTKIKLRVNHIIPCDCVYNSDICKNCDGSGFEMATQKINNMIFFQSHKKCGVCNGKGKIYKGCELCEYGMKSESIIVILDITPELEDGHIFTFPEMGNKDPDKKAGDFLVRINYEKHSFWSVSNKNLVISRIITLKQALTGYQELLIHPSGEEIHLCTSGLIIDPYEKLILYGKGLTNTSNILISVKIIFPNEISPYDIELVNKMNI